jgi:hypothetical protein
MKNHWTFLVLSVVLAGLSASAISETKVSDDPSRRDHRRAELRSALSAPVVSKSREGEKADNTGFHEHQLSAQERADLRRQLRDQFRVIGFESTQ